MVCVVGCCVGVCAPTALAAAGGALFSYRRQVVEFCSRNWGKILMFVLPVVIAMVMVQAGMVDDAYIPNIPDHTPYVEKVKEFVDPDYYYERAGYYYEQAKSVVSSAASASSGDTVTLPCGKVVPANSVQAENLKAGGCGCSGGK